MAFEWRDKTVRVFFSYAINTKRFLYLKGGRGRGELEWKHLVVRFFILLPKTLFVFTPYFLVRNTKIMLFFEEEEEEEYGKNGIYTFLTKKI